MVGPMRKSLLSKAVTAVCATVMCLGVTACGGNSSAKSDKSNSDSSSSSEKIGMHQIAGVTAKGELGKKPTVSFKTPMTVEDNSYVVLQKGDGARSRTATASARRASPSASRMVPNWPARGRRTPPDCSTVRHLGYQPDDRELLQDLQEPQAQFHRGVRRERLEFLRHLVPDVLTLVSKSKDLKKATGEKVAGVPADLPKVTLAKDGKPSIDMNGYKGSDSLVSQDLIKGKGAVVKDTQSVMAHYTGWLLDGTQFDSSWDRGQSSAFSLAA